MPDTYGAITIPAQTTGGGDPLLAYTADFIKAVLTAYATAAWQALVPTVPVVKRVHTDNPTDTTFNENDLPCLYVFRDESLADQKIEWLACDYRFSPSTVRAWLVLPSVTNDKRAKRFAILNAFVKTLDAAIENGRDPNWVVVGDPDPHAATEGSSFSGYAGWSVFGLARARRQKLSIPMESGKPPKSYEMLALEFNVEELLRRDITVGTDPNDTAWETYVAPDGGTGLGALTTGTTHLP